MRVSINALQEQYDMLNAHLNRQMFSDEEQNLIDGLNNLLYSIKENLRAEGAIALVAANEDETDSWINQPDKDEHEPHNLLCCICDIPLKNQCLHPDCTEDENHVGGDLVCGDLVCGECSFNIDQIKEHD